MSVAFWTAASEARHRFGRADRLPKAVSPLGSAMQSKIVATCDIFGLHFGMFASAFTPRLRSITGLIGTRPAMLILNAFLGLTAQAPVGLAADAPLTPSTLVKFADAGEAAMELGRKDAFVDSLSPFDRAARKKTDQPVSQEEFLQFVSQQALGWQGPEIGRLTRVLGRISNKIERLQLPLPSVIRLLKTTGKEEGGAAYCRGNNILISAKHAAAPDPVLERLLTHELFHILSRNNRKLRDSLYSIVGFRFCGEVAYPKELAARKLTNPDAPVIEHFITVTAQGKPTPVVPILFSKEDNYDLRKGGEFFAYLTFNLLVVEQRGEAWFPAYQESGPRLLDADEAEGFREQIGRNTEYVIHPEEILADNFVLLVQNARDVKTPRILEEMRRILTTVRPVE